MIENPELKVLNVNTSDYYQTKYLNDVSQLLGYSFLFREYSMIRNRHVSKAIGYIATNFKERIALTDVADYIGVDSKRLSHLLNKYTHKGFAKIKNEFRLACAVKLLWESDDNLWFIAAESGFGCVRTLKRELRMSFGMSSTEIRGIYDRYVLNISREPVNTMLLNGTNGYSNAGNEEDHYRERQNNRRGPVALLELLNED